MAIGDYKCLYCQTHYSNIGGTEPIVVKFCRSCYLSSDGVYNINDPITVRCRYIESYKKCTTCGGDGKVDKPINCRHNKGSSHQYCSHDKTSQHD